MAILAGDALLTRAFQVLGEDDSVPAERRIALVAELARAAGTVEGMIGGQVEDLEAEGKPITVDQLDYIHRSKTGALLRGSVRMGAIWSGADSEDVRDTSTITPAMSASLSRSSTTSSMSLPTRPPWERPLGKDAEQQKATFPALYTAWTSRSAKRASTTKPR